MLRKILTAVVGSLLLVAGFLFSVVFLIVFVVLGATIVAYFWWRTRALRKHMREAQAGDAARGTVIDGEAVVVDEVVVQQRIETRLRP